MVRVTGLNAPRSPRTDQHHVRLTWSPPATVPEEQEIEAEQDAREYVPEEQMEIVFYDSQSSDAVDGSGEEDYRHHQQTTTSDEGGGNTTSASSERDDVIQLNDMNAVWSKSLESLWRDDFVETSKEWSQQQPDRGDAVDEMIEASPSILLSTVRQARFSTSAESGNLPGIEISRRKSKPWSQKQEQPMAVPTKLEAATTAEAETKMQQATLLAESVVQKSLLHHLSKPQSSIPARPKPPTKVHFNEQVKVFRTTEQQQESSSSSTSIEANDSPPQDTTRKEPDGHKMDFFKYNEEDNCSETSDSMITDWSESSDLLDDVIDIAKKTSQRFDDLLNLRSSSTASAPDRPDLYRKFRSDSESDYENDGKVGNFGGIYDQLKTAVARSQLVVSLSEDSIDVQKPNQWEKRIPPSRRKEIVARRRARHNKKPENESKEAREYLLEEEVDKPVGVQQGAIREALDNIVMDEVESVSIVGSQFQVHALSFDSFDMSVRDPIVVKAIESCMAKPLKAVDTTLDACANAVESADKACETFDTYVDAMFCNSHQVKHDVCMALSHPCSFLSMDRLQPQALSMRRRGNNGMEGVKLRLDNESFDLESVEIVAMHGLARNKESFMYGELEGILLSRERNLANRDPQGREQIEVVVDEGARSRREFFSHDDNHGLVVLAGARPTSSFRSIVDAPGDDTALRQSTVKKYERIVELARYSIDKFDRPGTALDSWERRKARKPTKDDSQFPETKSHRGYSKEEYERLFLKERHLAHDNFNHGETSGMLLTRSEEEATGEQQQENILSELATKPPLASRKSGTPLMPETDQNLSVVLSENQDDDPSESLHPMSFMSELEEEDVILNPCECANDDVEDLNCCAIGLEDSERKSSGKQFRGIFSKKAIERASSFQKEHPQHEPNWFNTMVAPFWWGNSRSGSTTDAEEPKGDAVDAVIEGSPSTFLSTVRQAASSGSDQSEDPPGIEVTLSKSYNESGRSDSEVKKAQAKRMNRPKLPVPSRKRKRLRYDSSSKRGRTSPPDEADKGFMSNLSPSGKRPEVIIIEDTPVSPLSLPTTQRSQGELDFLSLPPLQHRHIQRRSKLPVFVVGSIPNSPRSPRSRDSQRLSPRMRFKSRQEQREKSGASGRQRVKESPRHVPSSVFGSLNSKTEDFSRRIRELPKSGVFGRPRVTEPPRHLASPMFGELNSKTEDVFHPIRETPRVASGGKHSIFEKDGRNLQEKAVQTVDTERQEKLGDLRRQVMEETARLKCKKENMDVSAKPFSPNGFDTPVAPPVSIGRSPPFSSNRGSNSIDNQFNLNHEEEAGLQPFYDRRTPNTSPAHEREQRGRGRTEQLLIENEGREPPSPYRRFSPLGSPRNLNSRRPPTNPESEPSEDRHTRRSLRDSAGSSFRRPIDLTGLDDSTAVEVLRNTPNPAHDDVNGMQYRLERARITRARSKLRRRATERRESDFRNTTFDHQSPSTRSTRLTDMNRHEASSPVLERSRKARARSALHARDVKIEPMSEISSISDGPSRRRKSRRRSLSPTRRTRHDTRNRSNLNDLKRRLASVERYLRRHKTIQSRSRRRAASTGRRDEDPLVSVIDLSKFPNEISVPSPIRGVQ